MRRTATVALAAALAATALTPALAAGRPPVRATTPSRPGLARLGAAPGANGQTEGIATFRAVPTAQQVAALRRLGLATVPMRHLPMALVKGPRSALVEAVRRGIARDVYPNERMRLLSKTSNKVIKADRVQAPPYGLTGKGVGVAIVDTGIDGDHPDLTKRVTHNFKVLGPEYVQQDRKAGAGSLFVNLMVGPTKGNADTYGHGTHVAGIVAADGSADPELTGVAPGADLIGYCTGEALLYTLVASFDDILEHRDEWKIRVVNNSWGSNFRIFDPDEPVNLATKALHDAGIVVVFAAGNSSIEMAIGPNSVAPWVISVASTAGGSATKAPSRSTFTSGGLEYDNSSAAPLGAGEPAVGFDGDTIGLYHPDVAAPGTAIVSTASSVGVVVTGIISKSAIASGTSMASPHVAGAAAILLEAKPDLTPDQVRDVLQVTSRPLSPSSPFWQVGYGAINLQAAVDYVRTPDFSQAVLDQSQAAADAKVLNARKHVVLRTDFRAFEAAPASVKGSDNRTYAIVPAPGLTAVKALVTFPNTGYVGRNDLDYKLTLTDAAGTLLGTSTTSKVAGVSTLFVDFTGVTVAPGNLTLKVSGELGAQDQDQTILGRRVTVTMAQLQKK